LPRTRRPRRRPRALPGASRRRCPAPRTRRPRTPTTDVSTPRSRRPRAPRRKARLPRSRTTLDGRSGRTIAESADGRAVETIDQRRLPHALEVVRLSTLEDAARAIETMVVRGAPLIGATAAYGV